MAIVIASEAAKKIYEIMKTSGLDPKRYAIEVSTKDGRLGINFLREQDYFAYDEIEGLKVVHMNENINVRLVMVNGKQGFVFE